MWIFECSLSTWFFSTLYNPTNILKVATQLTEQKPQMVPTLFIYKNDVNYAKTAKFTTFNSKFDPEDDK